MDNHGIIDIGAAAGLFLFTGVETMGAEGAIFEIISKFGVVAVLWFWLRDMKSQMKEMLQTFDKETQEIRQEHKQNMELFTQNYSEYNDRIDKQLKEKDEQIRMLAEKIAGVKK